MSSFRAELSPAMELDRAKLPCEFAIALLNANLRGRNRNIRTKCPVSEPLPGP
jgi:hypothetical protein